MYKIVLKVPEIVFIIFIFLPIFLIIGGYFPDAKTGMILSMIGMITGIFWMMGVSDYFDKALGNKKPDWIFLSVLTLLFLAATRDIYQNFAENPSIYTTKIDFPILTIVFDVIIAILLTLKIKKVFYARSIWFTFFEIMAYAFGVATLTPEIKNHYRENRKKMDKIFAGDENEELLN
jgi:hypothetical protein